MGGFNPFTAPPPATEAVVNHIVAADDRMDIDDDENKLAMDGISQYSQPPPVAQLLGSRRSDFEQQRPNNAESHDEGRDRRGRPPPPHGRGEPRWGPRDDREPQFEREFSRNDRGGDHRDQRDNRMGGRNERGADRSLQDRLRELAGVANEGGRPNRDFPPPRGDRGGDRPPRQMDGGPPMRDFNRMEDFERRGGFPPQGRNFGGQNIRGAPPFGPRGSAPGAPPPFMRGGPRGGPGKNIEFCCLFVCLSVQILKSYIQKKIFKNWGFFQFELIFDEI